ncbi:MAG: class IIb bacteriocin, lactobin A/cerein 7B family [Bifidobacteriaceae bacterium]|jgi:lactobin A/cerein 7B family class IIb bacteriocin|nr:class IIb bacteriocin, lactobin A/cerein 7B family [Bifidobacteriaceae bacterium]
MAETMTAMTDDELAGVDGGIAPLIAAAGYFVLGFLCAGAFDAGRHSK